MRMADAQRGDDRRAGQKLRPVRSGQKDENGQRTRHTKAFDEEAEPCRRLAVVNVSGGPKKTWDSWRSLRGERAAEEWRNGF